MHQLHQMTNCPRLGIGGEGFSIKKGKRYSLASGRFGHEAKIEPIIIKYRTFVNCSMSGSPSIA